MNVSYERAWFIYFEIRTNQKQKKFDNWYALVLNIIYI